MSFWRVFILFSILTISADVHGTHIVGGEFELIHKTGFNYKLNMILYYDVVNAQVGTRDQQAWVAVYRKKDNTLVESFLLGYTTSNRVDYYQPSCSSGEVVTDKILYTLENIYLSPDVYNDPEGYYLAWERCCRNYNITNVFSKDPAEGIYAGQTFYLEFPPVVKDGEPFINTSPILFPPLNDYACPFRPYWVDFQGTDPDGDSLVYSLVTPLSTHSSAPSVPGLGANPGPYPEIQWQSGFGINNIMSGIADLEISSDGFLTVTPRYQGLYAFAVKVEEYRNQEKIGEVRRDFQLLVVNQCPAAEAPVVRGKKLADATFNYKENMTVTFSRNTPDEERCIEIQVTDPDASKITDGYTENISIKAIPIGFKDDISDVLPEEIQATLVNGSDATFRICFDECPFFESGSFQIGIVSFDDACALPLSDTLRINVFVEPPPNDSPFFIDGEVLNLTVQEKSGGLLTRDILAQDINNDSLRLDIIPVGFNPSDYGITLNPGENTPGEVEALLNWNYDCQQFSFDGQTEFPFILTVEDKDRCQFAGPDQLKLNLKIELPPNTQPDVDISVNKDGDNYHYLETPINKSLNFNVSSTDLDNDQISLKGEGINFELSSINVPFPELQGGGVPGLNGNFNWDIPCSWNLEEQDSLRMHFYTEDFDKCQITNQDTIIVDIKLLPPPSNPPVVNAFPLGNTVLQENNIENRINEEITLRLTGADSDPDNLSLSLLNPEDFPGLEFENKTGYNQISSDFIWNPSCETLQGKDSTLITGIFKIADDNCFEAKSDSLKITFLLKDIDDEAERFRAPNIITPNDDSYNDFFMLENIFDGLSGEEISMPEDNCAGLFEKIEIYNRWGRNVFISNEREFRWHAANQPTGVYYYYLKYSNKQYKGMITVLF